MDKKSQYIVCAALRNAAGNIICGPRHFDLIMHGQIRNSLDRDTWKTAQQGFIDQFGIFLSREEAYDLAMDNGQKRYKCGGDSNQLFSENLY